MMNIFLRIASYLFHPLLMPLYGAAIYYELTPRFIEPLIIKAKLGAIIIITILIPIIIYFLLKNLNIVDSIHLRSVSERKYPLMFQILLILLIIKMVFGVYNNPEMYYFFIAVLFSTLTALIVVLFNFKVSLHQMGIAGLTMFLIALSVHFKINLLFPIGLFFFFNGWVASSRLHLNAHTYPELILGFVLGVIPQLILLNHWL